MSLRWGLKRGLRRGLLSGLLSTSNGVCEVPAEGLSPVEALAHFATLWALRVPVKITPNRRRITLEQSWEMMWGAKYLLFLH